ncbi:protein O-glucosyltransferase 3 isoform X1 [Podarcis raffonei]|uniref:protein O-glucosyltransferase 3 isoform X1 n=1 Tax=Podarcis raffonei TaxID=65483 RepID=UPI0023290DD4|nr:protein O-glucosyltransferase 3 isoform X1 [Podarcis raffonei]
MLPRGARGCLQTALLLGTAVLWASRQSFSEAAAAEPPPAVSAERSLVWGPGLRAEATLPVRYFWLQAVGSDGRNFTRSPPGNAQFEVKIKPISPKEVVQIHVPKFLDRNDGSFLMRYRLYGSVKEGLKVEILYGGAHVAESPYILKGPVYHEYCECPEDAQIWEKSLSCPSEHPQITEDFAVFPSIDLQRMFDEVPPRFAQKMGSIVHYTVIGNHIYRRSLGKYTDFKMFSDEMLLSLARKVHLPDVEFYLNVADWPVEHRKANDTPGPLPILSWCGSLDSADLVLPTYNVTHSTLETLRGVTNDLLSIQGNTGPAWDNKTEQGFFRGRDSREERLQLVQLSKENPELLDAGITGYFFFREKEAELGKAPLMGFFDFFKENDEEVRKIAKEGQAAARELLQPHRFYCYYFKVFQKYAERQAGRPEIRDGMEFVPQPDDRTSVCSCHRKKPSKEEL